MGRFDSVWGKVLCLECSINRYVDSVLCCTLITLRYRSTRSELQPGIESGFHCPRCCSVGYDYCLGHAHTLSFQSSSLFINPKRQDNLKDTLKPTSFSSRLFCTDVTTSHTLLCLLITMLNAANYVPFQGSHQTGMADAMSPDNNDLEQVVLWACYTNQLVSPPSIIVSALLVFITRQNHSCDNNHSFNNPRPNSLTRTHSTRLNNRHLQQTLPIFTLTTRSACTDKAHDKTVPTSTLAKTKATSLMVHQVKRPDGHLRPRMSISNK